jgi:hypothetical protein
MITTECPNIFETPNIASQMRWSKRPVPFLVDLLLRPAGCRMQLGETASELGAVSSVTEVREIFYQPGPLKMMI